MRHAIWRRTAAAALALAALTAGLVFGLAQPGVARAPKVAAAPVHDIQAALARRGVRVGGKPVQAVVFDDANGRNLLVLSRKEKAGLPYTEAGIVYHTRTVLLYADHFVTSGGHTRSLRSVRDGDSNCPYDQFTDFRPHSLRVADLDGDNVGEVMFAYTLVCASDVHPLPFKLLLLENGNKFIVRGTTWDCRDCGDHRLADGKPEPAWSKWPAKFTDRAKFAYHRWAVLS